MKPNNTDQSSVSNGNGTGSPNGNASTSGQNELIAKIAEHCKCPIDIAKQALEMKNGNPAEAVALIQRDYKPGQVQGQ